MRERAPQKHIFLGLRQNTSAYNHNINALPFYYLWHGTIYDSSQWRNEPKHLGGAQSLRGSVATERGEDVGGEFLIFRLENVQSGAYLRRKFRLDDNG